MTRKLYYEDAYQVNFNAIVRSCEPLKENYKILLDQTCFYPEGGGQESDTGLLNGLVVQDVFLEQGEVYHVLKESLRVGEEVEGEINFSRRLDLMRQHTAEHILAGVIHQKYGYDNVGFHLSESYTSADFNGSFTKEEIEELEQEVNQAVLENRKVSSRVYTKKELTKVNYRSKIETENTRLVEIDAYDLCACCGTHVALTGEIGPIKLVDAKKYKGGTRFILLAGERAMKDYQQKQKIIKELSKFLSAKEDMILEKVKKQKENLKEMKQKYTELREDLFKLKIEKCIQEQKEKKIVCEIEENLTMNEMKHWLSLFRKKTNQSLLLCTPTEKGFRYLLSAQEDLKILGQEMNEALNGKGGGKDFYQGTFETTKDPLIRFIEEKNRKI